MLQGWYRRRSLHGAARRGRGGGGVERRDASGRPPRDASAQRAPYRRYTFASKTRRTYLARLLYYDFIPFPSISLSFHPLISYPCTQRLGISANRINYLLEYNYQPTDIPSSFL